MTRIQRLVCDAVSEPPHMNIKSRKIPTKLRNYAILMIDKTRREEIFPEKSFKEELIIKIYKQRRKI